MLGKTANVVTFLVLCFAYTSGQDYYEGYEDGAPYYGDIPGIQFTDGNITITELEKIVRDEVKAATKEIKEKLTTKFLRDNRLEDKINLVREKALDKERECRSKNYSYWDAGIPECRNCLEMDRCQENEACSRECRDILKILHLETAAADKEQQLQDHERIIASMQHKMAQQQTWIIVLTGISSFTFMSGAVCFIAFFFWVKNLRLSSATQASNDCNSANRRRRMAKKGVWQKLKSYVCTNKRSEDKELNTFSVTIGGPSSEKGKTFQEAQRLTYDGF